MRRGLPPARLAALTALAVATLQPASATHTTSPTIAIVRLMSPRTVPYWSLSPESLLCRGPACGVAEYGKTWWYT